MFHDPRLAEAFHTHVTADPDALALVVGDEQLTRLELQDLADRATSMLVEHGVAQGDTVVSQYATHADEVAVALAASRLGCTFIPIPRRLGAYECGYVLGLTRPKVFAVRDASIGSRLEDDGGAHLVSLNSISEMYPTPYKGSAPGPDVALIGFTSGTTGHPKGVMHSHESLVWTAERMRALADIQQGEAVAVTGAGAGAPGFTFFTYMPLVHGLRIVHAEHWDPARVLELVERHRCAWTVMVPTMLYQLIEAQKAMEEKRDVSSIRAVSVGGAFMSNELIQGARDVLGWEVLRMYAMSECMAHSSMELSDPEAIRTELDGRPGIDSELAAFSPLGVRLPDGEVGELGFKGPSLMLGYLGDADGMSSKMTADGFFLSGDLGRLTDTGAAKIVGRIKDMIIRGGFNIDPTEVEELARRHATVREVAVVGYPDEKFGERACAVVTVYEGATLTHHDLVTFLMEAGLSKEKLPEHLLVIDSMPTSPDGKFLKRKLSDLVSEDLGIAPAPSGADLRR